ncbi:hypothetical protein NGRA_1675, partial [Nosema granulosis]
TPTFSLKDSILWLTKGNNRAREGVVLCYLQDRNMFLEENVNCPHCKENRRTVDHIATKCDRMLSFDYTSRHNVVVRCITLQLWLTYNLKSSKKIRNHSVQEIVSNDKVEIRIKTDVKIQFNKPDIFVYDKVKKEISIIETRFTSLDNLQTVEIEKTRKYV